MDKVDELDGGRHRGGGFTAALVIFTAISAIATIANLAGADSIARNLPGAPSWAKTGIYAMGVLGIAGVAGLIGIWQWKKWGLFLYLGTGAVVFFLNLALNVGIGSSLLGLVGLAIIGALVKPNWHHFE